MLTLSLIPNGSYNSVSVATRAPMHTPYSRRCTSLKIVQPKTKHTKNTVALPSTDFFAS